jgi:hypothetical protein
MSWDEIRKLLFKLEKVEEISAASARTAYQSL